MPRYENISTQRFVELICRSSSLLAREGKLTDTTPKRFKKTEHESRAAARAAYEAEQTKLAKSGFEQVGAAGGAWSFDGNRKREQKIRETESARRGPALRRYASALAAGGSPVFKTFLGSGRPGPNDWETLFGELDLKRDGVRFESGFVTSLRQLDVREGAGEKIAALLASPLARFLHTVELDHVVDLDGRPPMSTVARALADWSHAPQLEKLSLWSASELEREGGPFGRLEGLWPRLEGLRYLYLCGGSAGTKTTATRLGTIDLPNLEHFARKALDFTREELADIVAARWPSLRAMTLAFGPESDVGVGDIEALLDGPRASHVTHLALERFADTNRLVAALAGSRCLRRLTHLSLSQGNLGAKGAKVLLEHHRKFAHLAGLALYENQLSQHDVEAIHEKLPQVDLHSAQRESGSTDVPYQAALYQERFWEQD